MEGNKLIKPTHFPILDQLKENQDKYQEELRKRLLLKNKLQKMEVNEK